MARFSDDELRRICEEIRKYANQATPGAINSLRALLSMFPASAEKKKLLDAIKSGKKITDAAEAFIKVIKS